jgi:predicted nucleic acid-binding protein
VTAKRGLVDTGPLVSLLGSALQHYRWTCAQLKLIRAPLLTCEAVIAETAFLLRRDGRDSDPLFELMERGAIQIAFDLEEHRTDVRALMRRYRSRPMSLADACLVRMSEMYSDAELLTLDADFRIYRRHGNRVIPVRMPE